MNSILNFVIYYFMLLSCLAISMNSSDLDFKIVGGAPCPIEISKFAVFLNRDRNLKFCGGSLITFNMVLTAAHCVVDLQRSPQLITVVAGAQSPASLHIQKRRGKRISIPREYKKKDNVIDVAVIEVDESFNKSATVGLVKLPKSRIYEIWKKCPYSIVMGWGRQEEYNPKNPNSEYEKKPRNPNLQCVTLQLLPPLDCNKYVTKGNYYILCAWYKPGGKDSCLGDAGGPMICDGTQIGIVSDGFGCALRQKPGFYTRVDVVIDFIGSVLNVEGRSINNGVNNIRSISIFHLLICIIILSKTLVVIEIR
ncbi:anionic trypsin-2-like [Harmonia axyridis]|uniref:anionic trypsin-2-like n=1 Tax=Harmonia axyridis TaxID=115357 RepID=UPI001E277145|nr:anionic trypsin-2-like [Harmonia axyridis]